MTRTDRVIATAVLLLVVVGTAAVLLKPVRDMREDVDAQRSLMQQQLALGQEQLAAIQQQLAVAQETRDVANRTEQRTAQLVAVSRSLLALTRGLEREAGATGDDVTRLAELAAQLERLLRETERHVESIDRKTPATTG